MNNLIPRLDLPSTWAAPNESASFIAIRRARLARRQSRLGVAVRHFLRTHAVELTAAGIFLLLAVSELVLLVKYLDLLRRVGG